MKNIVVYTDKNESKLADVLAQIDDANVRIENAENLRDYETLNPGLVVVESVPNIKDVLMTTKFKAPTLFIGDVFKGCTSLKDIYFESKDCGIYYNSFLFTTGLTVHAPKGGSVEEFFRLRPLVRFVATD